MATIVTRHDFEADILAKNLHYAFKGIGTNEGVLINVLTGYSNEQIQVIRRMYERQYGHDLLSKIKDETSGNFRTACVSLVENRIEGRCRLLLEAVTDGNLQKLIDVIAPLEANGQLVQTLKGRYAKMYGRDLIDDVMGVVSGEAAEALMAILGSADKPDVGQQRQDVATSPGAKGMGTQSILKPDFNDLGCGFGGGCAPPDQIYKINKTRRLEMADREANFLLEELEKLAEDRDEDTIRTIFCKTNFKQLNKTMAAYNDKQVSHEVLRTAHALTSGRNEFLARKQKVEEALMRRYNGVTLQLYSARARIAMSANDYYAHIIRECVEGAGTNDDRLTYMLVGLSHTKLGNVEGAYNGVFGRSLADDVESDTSGDYGRLLARLIDGNQPEREETIPEWAGQSYLNSDIMRC